MSGNDWTKGPWTIEDFRVFAGFSPTKPMRQAIVSADGTVAICSFPDDGDDIANAHLIAASPDLAEFVEQLFAGIDTGLVKIDTVADETLENVMARGRAALAKARGQS